MAGFLASDSRFSNGLNLGLAEELAADDYYKAKLAKASTKAAAKGKTKNLKTKQRVVKLEVNDVASERQACSKSPDKSCGERSSQKAAVKVEPECHNEKKSDVKCVELAESEHRSTLDTILLEQAQCHAAETIDGDPTALQEAICPVAGCLMAWTRQANYFEYACSRCKNIMRGARWHCAAHEEDCCAKCCPAPVAAAFSGGAGDIIDSWRIRNQTAATNPGTDVLGDLLAAQERMLQERRVELLEAVEARESRRTMHESSGSFSRPKTTPSASTADELNWEMKDSPVADAPATNLMYGNAVRHQNPSKDSSLRQSIDLQQPLARTCDLTLVLAGDLLDELASGYSQDWFQEYVHQCARQWGCDQGQFVAKLHDGAFKVQRPILQSWGFEGNVQGVFDVTSIIREHSSGDGDAVPAWFNEKRNACLRLLYGPIIENRMT